MQDVFACPLWYSYPKLKTTVIDYGAVGREEWMMKLLKKRRRKNMAS
jgi:hypothetical protein